MKVNFIHLVQIVSNDTDRAFIVGCFDSYTKAEKLRDKIKSGTYKIR